MNNKQILQDAPEGATHVSDNGVYYFMDYPVAMNYWVRGQEWVESGGIHHLCRALADIKEIESLRSQLETERLRLAACGVVANANTQETAKQAREMHDNYKSGSMDDVIRAVDSEMELRTRLATSKADGIRDALSHVTSCYDWEWECVSATDLQKLMIEYANQLTKEQGE